ncbi:MAG: DinB family protein [Acidobacteriota bacterium]
MQPDQARFFLNMMLPSIEMEAKTTKKVIAALPEDKRDYQPHEKSKNALDLAWHVVASEVWFLNGMISGEFAMGDENRPAEIQSLANVLSWYDQKLPPLVERLKGISDADMTRTISFFGIWNLPAVAYLPWLIVHTVHHRGQLSVYLRVVGGKVPSIYGGSADEPFQPPAA